MKLFADFWLGESENTNKFYGSYDVTETAAFTTGVAGGYGTCSFIIPITRDERYFKYRELIGKHVVLRDVYGRRVYEGFVLKTEVVDEGVQVDGVGYYQKADNVYFDMIYPWIEATTNLINNPTFTVNVSDSWNHDLSVGGAIAHYTTDFYSGASSCLITQPDSGGPVTMLAYVAVSGSTYYTFSLYAKDLDLAGKPSLWFYEDGGGGTSHHVEMTSISKSSWVRYTVTVETLADTTSISVGASVPNKGTGSQGSFMIDAVQLEQKAYATSYCDGSLGALYSWSGTADNSPSSRTAVEYTVHDIITDCVGMIPEWNDIPLALDGASTYVIGAQDYTDKKVRDAIESITSFGYKENDVRPIYFGLWNYQQGIIFPEPNLTITRSDWIVGAHNLRKSVGGLSVSMEEVYNKVYALYDDAEGPVKTDPVSDLLSQSLYGVIEGMVQNGATTEGRAMAESLRDMALERYKFPRQNFTLEINGIIRSWNGHDDYAYAIKAGDIVCITDLDVLTAHAGVFPGMVQSNLNGFVIETSYDSSSGVIAVTFGSSDLVFDNLMSRLGLSGGLQ